MANQDFETKILVKVKNEASKEYKAIAAEATGMSKGVTSGSAAVAASTKKATEAVKKSADQAKKTGRAFTGLAGSVKGLVGAYLGIQGIRIATQFLVGTAQAAIVQEQALTKLQAVVKSTGGSAGFTAEALAQMAGSLQKTTIFGDEAIINMQALLATFTQVRGPIFQEATKAILNVSNVMGGDLQGAALQVGKALNAPIEGISALSRSGIQFSQSQKDMIKSLVETGRVAEAQKMILAELEIQFGGSAEAAAKTASGGYLQMQNRLGDIREEIGARVIPVLTSLGEKFISVWDTITNRTDAKINIGLAKPEELKEVNKLLQDYEIAVSRAQGRFGATGDNLKAAKQAREALVAAVGSDVLKKGNDEIRELIAQRNRILAAPPKSSPRVGGGSKKAEDQSKFFDISNNPEIASLIAMTEQRNRAQDEAVKGQADALQKKLELNQKEIDANEKVVESYKKLSEEMKQRNIDAINAQMALVSGAANLGNAMLGTSRKNAQARKRLAISEAIVNGGLGITKTFATMGYPAGLPFALALAANTAATVIRMKEQKFAHGGVVGGNSTFGDRVPVRANSGEMVLTGRQQGQLFSMANGGGGGSVNWSPTIIVNGATDVGATRTAIAGTMQEQMRDFSRLQRRTRAAMV